MKKQTICNTLIVGILPFVFSGCTTDQLSRQHSSHPNWDEAQLKLFERYRSSINWLDCVQPDYSDNNQTNLVISFPDGFSIEMVWCPRGIVAVGDSIENIVTSLGEDETYKESKNILMSSENEMKDYVDDIHKSNVNLLVSRLNKLLTESDYDFIHHEAVKGFWISKKVFTANDFKRLCPRINNDNNDRIRRGDGVTWNEAMLVAGAVEAQAVKSGIIKLYNPNHWSFRLPTVAELRYAALGGSIEQETQSTTNAWGIELSQDFLWCYDVCNRNWSKTIYDHVVTNGISSSFPTSARRMKMERSRTHIASSPYNLQFSPKTRIVLAPDCGMSHPRWDFYMSTKYSDSLAAGNLERVFFNERILWAKAFIKTNGLGWLWWCIKSERTREEELKQNLKEYIAFMERFNRYDAPEVSKEDQEILLGYSLAVSDYIMFRELTKRGTKKTHPSLQPAMILAATAHPTCYLAQLYAMGGKINTRTSDGTTPLHAAVAAEEKDNVEWLISHGADTNARDIDGKTPYDIAKENNYWTIAELFEQNAMTTSQNSLSLGSAFFINDNTIITCHHVIEECKEIWTETEDGTRLDFVVLAQDVNNDIAILKAKTPLHNHTSLPISSKLETIASKVFTIGYPIPDIMGSEKKYNDGTISALSGIGNDNRFYQISIPIQPGNSGGAVVSEEGLVIGLAAAALDAEKVFKLTGSIPQNVNYAIKSRYITALLQDNGIPYDETPLKSGSDPKTIVDQVSRATILLQAR